jgi:hypothetical protein
MIAELARMPPQQLAQYAEQNKDDTMVFLAAKAASDMQRKQMAASAPQQQQPAAPPVADQVVNQMAQALPEDVGIGALPVPEMKHMAAGGIVAFNDGGVIFDPVTGVPISNTMPSGNDLTMLEQLGIFNPENRRALEQAERAAAARKALPTMNKATMPAPDYVRPPSPGAGSPSIFSDSLQAVTGAPQPTPDPNARRAPRAETSAQPVQQPGETSEAMFARILKNQPDARANLPKEIQEAEDIKTEQANKVLASEKEAQTGLAALFGKKESRLLEKEKRLADKSSNDVNMALIDAGLAMMQSRGQGLAGIAEGASVGMKRYTEESRLTEAARQKIEDAREAYDDLKYNREDMSRKQILAAKGTIADARVASKSANIAEIARREGVNLKTAEKIFEADTNKALQAQQQQFQKGENALNRATQVSVANAPSGQMQLAAALGNGNIEAGLRKMTEIAAGKFNIQDAYTNYLRTMGPGGMGLTPQEFAAQIRALTLQVQDKPGSRP